MLKVKRNMYVGSVSALAIWAVAACAHAGGQVAASDAAPAKDESVTEVVVTGSRITSRGFTQPTPTTTLSTLDIQKTAEPNIFNTVAQLPALQGSTGRQARVNSTSSGQQGLSSFSLRGLGEIRTLTLLDGQRVTPANFIGVPDVSQFPQLLVKRVDVVTGGASASYGSDAVGGVVNFITDKKFEGLKANIEGGETTYGDDKNITAQLAWGRAFLNGRLNVEGSGEYGYEGGVPSGGFGVTGGANGRTWYDAPSLLTRPNSATTDGLPKYTVIHNAQQYQYTKYGLITSGPLQGTAFGVNGTPFQFQYGSNGVPVGNGTVTGCYSPFCVGGDLSGDVGQGTSLASRLQRQVLYNRVGYDLDDNNEIYFTANLARVTSMNIPNAGAERGASLTIQCENPFVPASIQAACATNNITSFQFGTSNGGFPNFINVHTRRKQQRFVVGADGSFGLFGTRWTYDAYAAHGENDTAVDVRDIMNVSRYNKAIDAIVGPNNTIICRDPVAVAAGCKPLNIIGQVTIDPAALAYVVPENGPMQRSHQTQDVVSFNMSAEPFSSWAGPVGVATGFEFRSEAYRTVADPYGNGVSADSPNSVDYPADPVMNTAVGNNWYAGNYHNGHGKYNVGEAYVELNVPVLNSATLGEANINLATRETHYSTAGDVNAWKIGGTWKTAIDGLRFRAVTSQDVRAPNLSELFAAPIVTNSTVNYNGTSITVQRRITGNTDLVPELARNTEIGVVLAQPKWLPGFSASLDYYDIKIDNAISGLSIQQIVDLCAAGNQAQCDKVLLDSPTPNTNYVEVSAFNAASLATRGYDIEATYRTSMSGIGLPGNFTVRALATHVIDYITTSDVIGTIPIDTAGVNGVVVGGTTPSWKGLFTESWDTDTFSLSLTQRWISDGVYSNEWIECQTNCPVATDAHPTIDNNKMKGYLYVDAGGTYKVSEKVTAYFKVDNLFNKSPAAAPQTDVGYGANPYLYDVLGRMYRVGFRMNF